jgi:hypothetical protein
LSVEHCGRGVDIFVTDYTRNDLFDDIQNSSWGSIGRKRVLRISVWPQEKCSYKAACLVKTGKFYLLKNFVFKFTNFGWAAKVISRDNAEFRQVRKDSQDPDLRRLMEWVIYLLSCSQQLTMFPRRKAEFNLHEVDEDEEVSGMDGVYSGNPMDVNQASSSVAEAKPVPVEGRIQRLLSKIMENLMLRKLLRAFIWTQDYLRTDVSLYGLQGHRGRSSLPSRIQDSREDCRYYAIASSRNDSFMLY